MQLSLDNMQPDTIVLQWDCGSEYSHKQQNSGTYNHPKQLHLLPFYIQHSPTYAESGSKVGHMTDVVTFWIDNSDDHESTKDCHSIIAAIEWVIEKYFTNEQTHVIAPGQLVDFVGWADGCGEQKKGGRTFRCLTELPAKHKGHFKSFVMNFACTGHFGGAWDADCGRQCTKYFSCEKAAGTVNGKSKLLPSVRDIVEYLKDEMSVTLRKQREQQGGAVAENRDYTINHSPLCAGTKRTRCPGRVERRKLIQCQVPTQMQ